jgi:hypothetical protein
MVMLLYDSLPASVGSYFKYGVVQVYDTHIFHIKGGFFQHFKAVCHLAAVSGAGCGVKGYAVISETQYYAVGCAF